MLKYNNLDVSEKAPVIVAIVEHTNAMKTTKADDSPFKIWTSYLLLCDEVALCWFLFDQIFACIDDAFRHFPVSLPVELECLMPI